MPKSFQKKKILTISVAHFFHDIYQAFFAPMMPLLMAKFGLSLTAVGILDIARRAPSLATPLIGLIADKKTDKIFYNLDACYHGSLNESDRTCIIILGLVYSFVHCRNERSLFSCPFACSD